MDLIAAFSCGNAAIDAYLHTQALAEQARGWAQVFVAVQSRNPSLLVGFYTLSPLTLRLDAGVLALMGLNAGEQAYPQIGAYLLGRLGVDSRYHNQGIGEALVARAFESAQRLRQQAGGAFLVVDPKDDRLVAWYERLGFRRLSAGKRRVAKVL